MSGVSKEESDFLHEISTPITIAIGQIEAIMDLKEEATIEVIEERAAKSLEFLEQVVELVNRRRKFLVEQRDQCLR